MNKWHEYFEGKERSDGTYFTFLSDKAPDSLKELIHCIHSDLGCGLPNDWIYQTIRNAFEDLAEDDIEDIHIESDIYTTDLVAWLDNHFAIDLCNEAIEDELAEPNIISIIGFGQVLAKDRIYHSVNEFIKDEASTND